LTALVAEIRVDGDAVEVCGEGGTERCVPFRAGYLREVG
jgi:hypothetical protein